MYRSNSKHFWYLIGVISILFGALLVSVPWNKDSSLLAAGIFSLFLLLMVVVRQGTFIELNSQQITGVNYFFLKDNISINKIEKMYLAVDYPGTRIVVVSGQDEYGEVKVKIRPIDFSSATISEVLAKLKIANPGIETDSYVRELINGKSAWSLK